MSQDQHFEAIAHGYYLEGLLIGGDSIWYTDVAVGGVQQVGSTSVLLPDRPMIGGLQLNEDGSLLVSGPGGIAWVNPSSGRSGTLIDGLDGVNEMRADARGGIYFGTIDLAAILRGERPGPSTIQYLSTQGERVKLWGDLTFANGLVVSADGRDLIFNESFSAVRAFGIGHNGALNPPRTVLDLYDCDGMALDAEGNVWVTGFASNQLRCVTPSGEAIRSLSLPGLACTNVRFGGADLKDLYVTIVDPASAQALAEGKPLQERNSTLYKTRSPVAGAAVETSRFAL